ncbi:MAG: hypothetical protein GQ474_00500 [Sulfurimonas sp.]|nr:hypothetical protein [Sulfurimonas sp.]
MKGLMEGLMAAFSAVSEKEAEPEEAITARDLRKHYPMLYKEYVTMKTGQSVEDYLLDKNLLDDVMMVMEQDEMKEGQAVDHD